jgi:replicative DNA helicase
MQYIDDEAEVCLLSSMVMGNAIIDDVRAEVAWDDFYADDNREIFRAITKLKDEGKSVDIVILSSLGLPVSPVKIAMLGDSVPSASNWKHYAERVIEKSLVRKFQEIVSNPNVIDPANIKGSIEEATNKLVNAVTTKRGRAKIKTACDLMVKAGEHIDRVAKNPGAMTGHTTGFRNLDRYLDGLQKGINIIGARPATGKTACATKLAINIAMTGTKVGFFQIEMKDTAVALRAISGESGINARLIKAGHINAKDAPADSKKMIEAMTRIAGLPLYIDDETFELQELLGQIRYMVRVQGIKYFFIDHFSKIEHKNKRLPRHEQYAEISGSLARIAKQLDISITILFQVGRGVEGKEPSIADLRETGASEQDADVVMLLYGDRQDDISQEERKVTMLIAKNREGPCGKIPMIFDTNTVSFREA